MFKYPPGEFTIVYWKQRNSWARITSHRLHPCKNIPPQMTYKPNLKMLKAMIQWKTLILFLGLFMFRFFYGGKYGEGYIPLGKIQSNAGAHSYVYIGLELIILMFFLRFVMRRQ